MITLYHGATSVVESPLCNVGRANLDFGQGFYVTDIKEQAVRWALRQARDRGHSPVLNVYRFDRECVMRLFRNIVFAAYDEAWLDFIVRNRNGEKVWAGYDYIEGGVADDRVIDTVNLYTLGLIPSDIALERLLHHKPNNQMCLLSQDLTDKCLRFDHAENIKIPADNE